MAEPAYKPSQDEVLQGLANAAEMHTQSQEDYWQYMGQVYYLLKDELMTEFMVGDPDLFQIYPTFSHLMRTSNIDTDKAGKTISAIMKLRISIALRLQLLVNKNPSLVSYAKFSAMVNHGDAIVEDMKEGWRGRLVTEKIKTYKIEGTQQKSQGWLQKIFGR